MKLSIIYLNFITFSRISLESNGWLSSQGLHYHRGRRSSIFANEEEMPSEDPPQNAPKSRYDLGIGKHQPYGSEGKTAEEIQDPVKNWVVPDPVSKPVESSPIPSAPAVPKNTKQTRKPKPKRTRRMVARDQESAKFRAALWDEQHFAAAAEDPFNNPVAPTEDEAPFASDTAGAPPYPTAFYPDIDLSIPETVYSSDGSVDLVWDLLRWEAYEQGKRTVYENCVKISLYNGKTWRATYRTMT